MTKLSDAVHTRDAFLSMASHELKTPITSLRLQVESLLRAREGVTAPVAKAADATRRQVVRLTALVNTLLDVSRLNESRLQLELEPVDLSALVREVVSRFAAETELSRARIRVDAAAEVSGRWDWLRLEQVLTNLVSNALKYGEGKPHLSSRRSGRRHRVDRGGRPGDWDRSRRARPHLRAVRARSRDPWLRRIRPRVVDHP